MVNQSIALQIRPPAASGGGNSFAQNMQMMNMMAQRTAAERQAQQAQQTMGIQAAQETDRAALAKPALSDAEMKNTLSYMNYVYETASKSPDIASARAKLEAIGADPRFQEDMFQRGLAEVVSTLPSDPAQYKPWQDTTLSKTLSAADRLKQHFEQQDLGTTTRLFATPDLAGSGGGGQVVPGSTATKTLSPDKASEVTYAAGPNGSVIPVPKYLPSAGGVPTSAPTTTGNAPTNFNDAWSKIKQLEGGMKNGQMQTSSAGAVGPAQLMPDTAKDAAKMANVPWDESKYRTDPAYNEKLGKAYYASRVAARNGDFAAAALDYHTGMGNVDAGNVGPKGREYAANFAGAAPAATGGAGSFQLGKPVPGTGKGVDTVSADAKKNTAAALIKMQEEIVAAKDKGHLLSDDNSYMQNQMVAARMNSGAAGQEPTFRTYLPGGVQQKSSIETINKSAGTLLRTYMASHPGTASTFRTQGEQNTFLRSVGGGDSTYETRMAALQNFARANGITLPPVKTASTAAATRSAPTQNSARPYAPFMPKR